MKKWTFWRNAIVAETHIVEAATEEEALEMLRDCGEPVKTEWIDWATDVWELEEVEIIDPLYRMVKDYDSA